MGKDDFIKWDKLDSSITSKEHKSYEEFKKGGGVHRVSPFKSSSFENNSSNNNSSKKSYFSFNRRRENSRNFFLELIHTIFGSSSRFKLSTIIFVCLLIFFFYKPLLGLFYSYLFQFPEFAALFSDISREWINRTLKGLFIMSFLGTLFFISIPIELIFLQYLSTSTPIVLIICVILLANMISMALNYGIGLVLGQRVLHFLLRKSFLKYQERIQNYGGFLIVIGNIIPSPIELISVFLGGMQYDFKTYMYLTAISRVIKYILLIILVFQFPDIIKYIIL